MFNTKTIIITIIFTHIKQILTPTKIFYIHRTFHFPWILSRINLNSRSILTLKFLSINHKKQISLLTSSFIALGKISPWIPFFYHRAYKTSTFITIQISPYLSIFLKTFSITRFTLIHIRAISIERISATLAYPSAKNITLTTLFT
jgi:hypothetical protein